MGQPPDLQTIFGTKEPPAALQPVTLGALSFFYAPDGLRRIAWHGTELVRALMWPVRDESWDTYPAQLLNEEIDAGAGEFEARLRFAVAAGQLTCDLRLAVLRAGELFADLVMTPAAGGFSTNRAGFTVLHPIQGVAGAGLQVRHSDTSFEATRFPNLIQPDQPVKDIRGLRYGVGGVSVNIDFEGEVFEMEDQRNWSDASFKTYCVPLVHPFTYQIETPTRQSLRLTFSGGAGPANTSQAPRRSVRFAPTKARAPQIGLAMQAGWLPDPAIPLPDVSHTLLRVTAGEDVAALARAVAPGACVDLELVVPQDAPVAETLGQVADALRAEGVTPAHVLALPEGYLASHQPSGPWPDGPTPGDLLAPLRAAFPEARVMGGMMTNFTELNRCRPDPAGCDAITHGLTPLVHAGDDMSVLETLEALPQIFASTAALAPGLPCRLGLVSIGMRSNPYGAAVAENPDLVRRTMAQLDPRHRGLFGAAFAVGVLAATQSSAVEALCLGAPSGPFGLGADGALFPLYHVLRAAAGLGGGARIALQDLPADVVGYGAVPPKGGAAQAMLANLSAVPVTVDLGGDLAEPHAVLVLDTATCAAAAREAQWLDRATRTRARQVTLGPFAVAFLNAQTKGALQ